MSLALVLSGGGARGAFTVGVLQELLPELARRGQRIDIVAATSTGAFIAPFTLLDRVGELAYFYNHLNTEDVLALKTPGQALRTGALASPAPTRGILERFLAPSLWDEFAAQVTAGRHLMTTAVNLQTNELFVFHVGQPLPAGADRLALGYPVWRWAEVSSIVQLRAAVLASGCEPARLDAVPITYAPLLGSSLRYRAIEPGESGVTGAVAAQFVDGGVRSEAPIAAALAAGASEVFMVSTQPSPAQRAAPAVDAQGHWVQYSNFIDVVYRLIDILLNAVLDRDEQTGEALGSTRFHLLRPDSAPGDSLDFDPGVMSDRLFQGRDVARRWIRQHPSGAVPPPPIA